MAFVIVLGVTYFAVGQIPRTYEAFASILVEPRQVGGALGSSVDRPKISSLVELLRSRETMAMVVDREKLYEIEEFGGNYSGPRAREEAIARLTGNVVVSSSETTAMFYIRGRSMSPDLARRITLAVAEAGLDGRVAMVAADFKQTSGWLGHEIDVLGPQVASAEEAVAQFLERQNIFLSADGRTLDQEQMADLASQINVARERVLLQQARVKLWRQWQADGDPRLGTILSPGGNTRLVEDYAAAQAELASISSRLGPDHPTSRATSQRASELRAQLAAAAETTIRGAETEIAAGNALIAALRRDLAETQSTVSTQLTERPELEALRREADAQRTLLQNYLGRYQSALTMSEPGAILPDMRIIVHPVEPSGPIAPRTSLIVGAAAIVMAMAILSAMVVAGMQTKKRAITL